MIRRSNQLIVIFAVLFCFSPTVAFGQVTARLPETPVGPDDSDPPIVPDRPNTPVDPRDPFLDPCPTDAIDGHRFSMRFDSGETTVFRGSEAQYDEGRGIWYMDFRVGDGGRYGRVTMACARNPNVDLELSGTGTPELFYDWGWSRPRDGSEGRNTDERLNNVDDIMADDDDRTACFNCGVIRDVKGCFPPGVRVALDENGATKKVEEIAVGDKLWNPVLKTQVAVERVIEGPESLPIIELSFSEHSVRMTQGHPVKTDKGIKAAKTLTLDDKVLGSDGEYHSVDALKALPVRESQRVINFVMAATGSDAEARMISADGLVTGDYVVQQEIAPE